MKISERFALNEWLSDYPQDKTYSEILDLMYEDEDLAHELISVWHVIQNMPLRGVMECIDNTRCHFEQVVRNMKAEEVAA